FFVERGNVVALEPVGATSTRVSVAAGNTYSRKAADKGSVASGLDRTLLESMPRTYRDTLPALLPQVGTRTVQPKPAPASGFADVEEWLKSDSELRRCLVAVMVRSAQETLTRRGFDVGPIDGVLGPRTQGALREFQQQQGLNRSGQLDEETLKALDVADRR
ncbi:MAG TPA: peptidoglycan-binding domain-containing protein, partial [Burkholderiaceae bacterium]|nr:peptidoglycan-binding domain-containing protein [Burkholderiaceae bacterium]